MMQSFARCRRFVFPAVLITIPLLPGRIDAQVGDSTHLGCDGQTVRSVHVQARRPVFRGALGWWRKVARAFGLHHETTSEGLIRRFVSLDPGSACTEFRRSESERILRAQPYLADATVTTTRAADGIHVNVETVDEVPVVGGARFHGARVDALSLGTMNFLGAGMHVEGRWERGRSQRDGFGGRVGHTQLLGRPYTFTVEGAQRPAGEYLATAFSHPFLTDLQRIAWHSGYGTSNDFAYLRRPDRARIAQPVNRTAWDVGGVLRVGPPRRLGLVGGAIVAEHMVARNEFALVDSITDRRVPTTDTAGLRRYPSYDLVGTAGVLGLRALRFTRMEGLDALAAAQDVATGTQIGTLFGARPFEGPFFGDGFASLDIYVGGRTRHSFAAVRAEMESRLDLEHGDWRHLVASGRAAWYLQPRPRWVSELSVEFGGGWRTIMPFQLELGERRGGLRGYARSLEVGSQRLLARLEQRLDLARYQRTRAALGAAAFADAGRIWAGDVPFGVTTPVRASIGVGLLAAVPAQSQRTIRADFAMPLYRATGARPELRFTIREPIPGFWVEPPTIRWARLTAVPEQIFSWP